MLPVTPGPVQIASTEALTPKNGRIAPLLEFLSPELHTENFHARGNMNCVDLVDDFSRQCEAGCRLPIGACQRSCRLTYAAAPRFMSGVLGHGDHRFALGI